MVGGLVAAVLLLIYAWVILILDESPWYGILFVTGVWVVALIPAAGLTLLMVDKTSRSLQNRPKKGR